MLSGYGNENSQNKSVGLISKKKTTTTLFVQHTFYVHFFALFCETITRNFLVTRFMEETLNVFLFTFFAAANLHLVGC